MALSGAPLKNQPARAPYIYGELRKSGNADKLFNLIAVPIFLIMPVTFLVINWIQRDAEVTFVSVWLMIAMLATYAEWQIKPRKGIYGFQVFAISLALIGLPGMYFLNLPVNFLLINIAYVGVIAVRLMLVFVSIPRCLLSSQSPPVQLVLRWFLVGTSTYAIVSSAFYASNGITPATPARANFENWIHPNHVGLFGCFCIYLSLLTPRLHPALKYGAMILGIYTVLAVQSRSAIVTALACVTLIYILNLIENPQRYALRGFIGAGTIALLGAFFGTAFRNLGAVKNIEARTFESDDPTAGRLNFIEQAIEAWKQSPIFGLGYRTGGVDNAYVTILMQTGIVGLILYLTFLAVVVNRGYQHFKHSFGEARLLGKVILVMSLSIFIHGFAESISFLKLTDLQSNAYCILASLAFLIPVGSFKPEAHHPEPGAEPALA